MVIAAVAVVSCNNNNSAKDNSTGMNHDSMPMPMKDNTMADDNVKMVATTFATVDPAVSTFMKSMVADYLAVKMRWLTKMKLKRLQPQEKWLML